MMQNAQDRQWKPISGIDAMIEQGIAQQLRRSALLGYYSTADALKIVWQQKPDLGEVEEKVRNHIRNQNAPDVS